MIGPGVPAWRRFVEVEVLAKGRLNALPATAAEVPIAWVNAYNGVTVVLDGVAERAFESGHGGTSPEFLAWRANHPRRHIAPAPEIPLERVPVGSGSELRPQLRTPRSRRTLAHSPA